MLKFEEKKRVKENSKRNQRVKTNRKQTHCPMKQSKSIAKTATN